MESNRTALLILAAGESRRMGKAKQLLAWKSATLLGNTIEKALTTDADEVFVVLGARFKKIKNSITQYPVTVIKNENWQQGLGASIACGVTEILKTAKDYSAILITLADLPYMDSDHFNTLIKKSKESEKGIIATSFNTTIGVPAIFKNNYFEKLSQLQATIGAKNIIKNHKNDLLLVAANQKHIDIDTPEDYRDLIH